MHIENISRFLRQTEEHHRKLELGSQRGPASNSNDGALKSESEIKAQCRERELSGAGAGDLAVASYRNTQHPRRSSSGVQSECLRVTIMVTIEERGEQEAAESESRAVQHQHQRRRGTADSRRVWFVIGWLVSINTSRKRRQAA